MLISTTTNATSEIGSVATSSFGAVAPFIYLIFGIIIAFFVAEIIIDMVAQKKHDREIDDTLDRLHTSIDL